MHLAKKKCTSLHRPSQFNVHLLWSRHINTHFESICKWKSHILETIPRLPQEFQKVFEPFSTRYSVVRQDNCAFPQMRKNQFKGRKSKGSPDYIIDQNMGILS